ncbi:AAA family ATPase [Streptomyces tauricus]|uniref:AAA family ATPase n=1 Tax=Streptomyces tauricus TaxID=68274 RepID=UPI00343A0BFC
MIEQLALTNFKAFRSAEIPLAPVTLLTGLNSSGKSSVLQALVLLRQSYDASTLFSADGQSEEQGGFLLNGELLELGTGQDVLHEDFVRMPNLPAPLIRVGFRTSDGRDHGWAALYASEQDVLPLYTASPVPHVESVFNRSFQYLKADRIVPATSYPRSHQQAIARGFLGARGEHTVNYLRHHAQDTMMSAALRHPEARGSTFLDHVVAWMQELCPGVNLEAAEIPGIDSVRLSYGFDGTAGLESSGRRRPTNVGFGLTYALPIVVACLTAGPNSLILLENPEAHLHPRGQSRMAALMAAAAAAGAQLVVETHSDHVLNGLRLAVKKRAIPAADTAVHYFRRQGLRAEIVTPRIHDDGTLSDWPPGFFDEWENSLEQLLD